MFKLRITSFRPDAAFKSRPSEKRPRTPFSSFKGRIDGKTTASSLFSIPPAKVLQLYGLENVSQCTKKITRSAKKAEADFPKAGKFVSFASWTAINLGLVKLGSTLTSALAPLGGAAAAAIGYTVAFIHPSCVSVAVSKLSKVKDKTAGVAEYLQARFFPGLISQPILFGSLGLMVHAIQSPTVTLTQGVGAVMLASLASLAVWHASFSLYWPKLIKRRAGEGLVENTKAYFRGLTRPFHKKERTENPYEEAGELSTAVSYYWLPLSYTARAASAVLAVTMDSTPTEFMENYFSCFALLSTFDIIGRGMETEKAEKIIGKSPKNS